MKTDQQCIATTMVDYYGLPQNRPGNQRSKMLGNVEEKAASVENAVRDDVIVEMGGSFNADGFLPIVVMQEFEGLLFSDCASFSRAMDRLDLEVSLRKIRQAFATPEDQ